MKPNVSQSSGARENLIAIRFKEKGPGIESMGPLNHKLTIMGNNDSFAITEKRIQNQVKEQEKSKVKQLKVNGIFNSKNQLLSRMSAKSTLRKPVQNPVISKTKMVTKEAPKVDVKKPELVKKEAVAEPPKEISVKDHIIYILMLREQTSKFISKRLETDSGAEVDKSNLNGLLGEIAVRVGDNYHLKSNLYKAPAEIKGFKYFSASEKLLATKRSYKPPEIPTSKTKRSLRSSDDNKNEVAVPSKVKKVNKVDSVIQTRNPKKKALSPKTEEKPKEVKRLNFNTVADVGEIQNDEELATYMEYYNEKFPEYLKFKNNIDNVFKNYITTKKKLSDEQFKKQKPEEYRLLEEVWKKKYEKMKIQKSDMKHLKDTQAIHNLLGKVKQMIQKYEQQNRM